MILLYYVVKYVSKHWVIICYVRKIVINIDAFLMLFV